MASSLISFLEELLPRVFQERPPDFAPWFFDYFSELESPGGRRRYARALQSDLNLAGVDVRGKRVLDAGSGFGITLLCLAAGGARTALGIEAFLPMIATAGRLHQSYAPGLPVALLRGTVHRLPISDRSLDFIYCNEALSHFLDPSAFLGEAFRVLRPGGRLMICDGNNALNRRTVRQVREVWRRFEEGPPGEDVHGHRIEKPYGQRRRDMIARSLPGLTEGVQERLAWGTFGLHGDGVVREARNLLARGKLPENPPVVETSPVDPDKGDHIERLVHPHELAGELRSLGFTSRIHAHFGGARSRWIAGANHLLRWMTPATLRFARSVKIVAERR